MEKLKIIFFEKIIMEFKIIVTNYLDCYVSCMELNKEHENARRLYYHDDIAFRIYYVVLTSFNV